MRVTTTMRRGLVVSVVALVLTGCSGNDGTDPFELTLGDMSRVACDEASDARNALTDALNAPEQSGQRNAADDWGLDPSSEKDIKQAIKELDERTDVCDNEPDDSTDSPKPSSEETATSPEIDESDDGSDDQSTDESDTDNSYADIVGWDQFVDDTPDGLQKSIGDNADDTGFGWSDIETWSEARMPNGKLVDARAVVVFGRAGLTDSEVLERVAITGDDEDDVPVVRAKRCYSDLEADEKVCPSGDDRLTVILAPVVMKGDTVRRLRPEAGVMLLDTVVPVTYRLR